MRTLFALPVRTIPIDQHLDTDGVYMNDMFSESAHSVLSLNTIRHLYASHKGGAKCISYYDSNGRIIPRNYPANNSHVRYGAEICNTCKKFKQYLHSAYHLLQHSGTIRHVIGHVARTYINSTEMYRVFDETPNLQDYLNPENILRNVERPQLSELLTKINSAAAFLRELSQSKKASEEENTYALIPNINSKTLQMETCVPKPNSHVQLKSDFDVGVSRVTQCEGDGEKCFQLSRQCKIPGSQLYMTLMNALERITVTTEQPSMVNNQKKLVGGRIKINKKLSMYAVIQLHTVNKIGEVVPYNLSIFDPQIMRVLSTEDCNRWTRTANRTFMGMLKGRNLSHPGLHKNAVRYNVYTCLNEDCIGSTGFVGDKPRHKCIVKCTHCSMELCSECGKHDHGGKCGQSAEEQSAQVLDTYKKGTITKNCPGCSLTWERIEGCDHITCPQCKIEWCWICGEKTPDYGKHWQVHNRVEELQARFG
jgi:hypothetical protein